MTTISQYKNGDFTFTLLNDGTLVKEGEGKCDFPHSLDIKITDWCNAGCAYCHEDSTTKGKHGNTSFIKEVLDQLPGGQELACLDEETRVGTPNGLIAIKDLNVGDCVYDEKGNVVRIVNKTISYKPCIELGFSKGQRSIVCTPDHIFINKDGKEIQAKDFLNQEPLIGKFNHKETKTIDLSESITISTAYRWGRSGKYNDNKVRICHSTPEVDRFITTDKDLMFLYGISVAEGSYKSIALNIKEQHIADEAIRIYKDKFNIDCNVYKKKNALVVGFGHPRLYSSLIFDQMQVGKGARNKSIKFLFGLERELIREALYSMFLGDGCFRKRYNKKCDSYSYSVSYKTTSCILANELQYILYCYFGLKSAFHYGWSPEREIEGRILQPSDYYKIDLYGKENLNTLFPKVYELNEDFQKKKSKYSSYKTQPFICNSIKEVGNRTVVDITLEKGSSHLFTLDNGIVTHNCGGGDPLSHPDLDEILIYAKERGLISNITVNQFHLNQETIERIESLSDRKLIWGVGISVNNVSTVPNLGLNTVYHLILGIHTPNQLDTLRERFNPCKVLLLGYKNNIGRGKTFYNQYIERNIREWYRKLYDILNYKDMILCFDNLALSQLQVKRLFKNEYWNSVYMGEDFTQSMYVDAVKEEYAPTSTSINRVSARDKSLLEFFKS